MRFSIKIHGVGGIDVVHLISKLFTFEIIFKNNININLKIILQ